jgi:hypothetical protein
MLLDAKRLLDRGFLPKELPPAFNTAGLGAAISGMLQTPKGLPSEPWASRPGVWMLARQGSLRRPLSIPNPLHYARLCLTLEANSQDLESRLEDASKPTDRYRATSLGRDLVMQVMSAEMGVLSRALRELLCYYRAGVEIPLEDVGDLLNAVVTRQSPQGHGSEVAWALWGLLEFKLELSSEAGGHLARSNDPVAALVGLHLRKEGLWGEQALDRWEELVSKDELYGEMWLFAYEAAHKGWLPRRPGKSPFQDRLFAHLHRSGVSFYDPARRMDLSTRGAPVLVNSAPTYG